MTLTFIKTKKLIIMKKTIYFLSVILLGITSCSKSDNPVSANATSPSDFVFPRKIAITMAIGNVIETNNVFNGNKIVESTTRNGFENKMVKTVYTYTGNLITKKSVGNSYITDYNYENGKLKSAVISYLTESGGQFVLYSKSKFLCTYNADGSILKELFHIDINTGVEVKDKLYSIITLMNGAIVKQVYPSSTINSTGNSTYTYEFDNKNNPYKNVLGFNELILDNVYKFSSPTINNLTKSTLVIKETFLPSGPTNSYTEIYSHQYVYNDFGFVIEDKELVDRTANQGSGLTSTTRYTY
jgi:hypothetical protein